MATKKFKVLSYDSSCNIYRVEIENRVELHSPDTLLKLRENENYEEIRRAYRIDYVNEMYRVVRNLDDAILFACLHFANARYFCIENYITDLEIV
jgi:hypothetical protein